MDTCCECLHEPVPIFAELLGYRLFHLLIHCNKTKIKIISKNWVRLSLAAKELWISRRVSVLPRGPRR